MVSKRYTVRTGARRVPPASRSTPGGCDVLDDPQINRGTAFTHGRARPPRPARAAAVGGRDDRAAGRPLLRAVQGRARPTSTSGCSSPSCTTTTRCSSTGSSASTCTRCCRSSTRRRSGAAIQEFSHLFRRPRGVFLNIDDVDGIDRALDATGLGPDDIDLVVASDAEAILGIGDWGVGGIDISIGKLAVYTVAAGIDPSRVLAVGLDVGTNREALLNDPRYLGLRRSRVRGEAYDAFIDAYVASARASASRTRSCTGRTSPARRPAASSPGTATPCARSTTTSRARRRSGLACVLAGVRVVGRPAGRPADRGLRRRLGRGRHRRPDRARDDRGGADAPRRPPTASTCSTVRACSPAT